MIEQGFVEEVRELIEQGKALRPAMNSVGYAQMRDWIEAGERDVGEVVDQIVLASLRLAKKQRTWFNRDSTSVQINCAQDAERGVDLALEFLTKRLG